MEVITLASLIALISKIVTVVKSIGKNSNIVLTQLLTWAVGVGVLALAANADVTKGFQIFSGHTLGSLDFASIVLLGLSYASGGSFAYDFKANRNPEPSLLPVAQRSDRGQGALVVLLLLCALVFGGVGLFVEALRWCLILALVLVVASFFTSRRV